MIKKYTYSLLKNVFLILIWIGCCNASGEQKNTQDDLKIGKDFNNNHKWFEVLSDFSVALEFAAIYEGNYSAKTAREVQFDALKIGNLHLHFGLREDILFNSSPAQLDHVINYLKTGYEIFNGRIIVLWDHTCHNPSRKIEENQRNGIHWNELGIGYESNGMMLGHKSDGIIFNTDLKWLNSIHWKAYLSKIWMRTENDYEWMLKIGARDDLFWSGAHVYYTQTDLDLIYDYRGINLNSNIEVGDRFHVNEYIYLIAYLGYEHFNDWYDLNYGENLFSTGLSLEVSLGNKSNWNHGTMKERDIAWDPACSVTGAYSNILDNDRYGHSSDFAIDLNLLKITPDILFGLNTYVGIITIPDDLNPYWIKYEIGPSFKIDLDKYYLDILYSYSSLYGVEADKSMRDYHRLSFEITKNIGAHWDINTGVAAYPLTSNFDYNGEIFGDLTFKLYPKGTTFYMNCSFKYLEGRINLPGYAIETGINILGKKGSCNIYWRHQEDIDIFKFEEGEQTVLGIRFRF